MTLDKFKKILYACIKAWVEGVHLETKAPAVQEKLSTVNTQQLSPLGSSGQPSTIGRAALCLHGQCWVYQTNSGQRDRWGGGGPAVVCHPSRWGDGPGERERETKSKSKREREQGKGQLDHGWSKALSKHVGEAAEEGDLSRHMILWPRINSMCKNCTLHAPCTMCTGPVKTHCRISHRGWSFYKNKVAEFYDCQRFYMCSVLLRKHWGCT